MYCYYYFTVSRCTLYHLSPTTWMWVRARGKCVWVCLELTSGSLPTWEWSISSRPWWPFWFGPSLPVQWIMSYSTTTTTSPVDIVCKPQLVHWMPPSLSRSNFEHCYWCVAFILANGVFIHGFTIQTDFCYTTAESKPQRGLCMPLKFSNLFILKNSLMHTHIHTQHDITKTCWEWEWVFSNK